MKISSAFIYILYVSISFADLTDSLSNCDTWRNFFFLFWKSFLLVWKFFLAIFLLDAFNCFCKSFNCFSFLRVIRKLQFYKYCYLEWMDLHLFVKRRCYCLYPLLPFILNCPLITDLPRTAYLCIYNVFLDWKLYILSTTES